MVISGDELYRRMTSRTVTGSQDKPSSDELIDSLRMWITWATQYGAVIGPDEQFENLSNQSVELINRLDN